MPQTPGAHPYTPGMAQTVTTPYAPATPSASGGTGGGGKVTFSFEIISEVSTMIEFCSFTHQTPTGYPWMWKYH